MSWATGVGFATDNIAVSPVPEPDVALLIVPAVFGLGLRQPRQRRRKTESFRQEFAKPHS